MATMTTGTGTISDQSVEQFTRQLGVLLSAGVDILRALQVAAAQSGNPRLLAISTDVSAALADGREFSKGLSHYPDVFSPFYVQMVQQGEKEGVLGATLLAVADYLQHESAPLSLEVGDRALGVSPSGDAGRRSLSLVLWSMAACAMGTAVLHAGVLIGPFPQDWLGPIVAGWVGLCLGLCAIRVGRQSGRDTLCSLCGRGQSITGPLVRGRSMAICSACLQSSINQLRPPDPPSVATPVSAQESAIAQRQGGPANKIEPPSRNGSEPQAVDEG